MTATTRAGLLAVVFASSLCPLGGCSRGGTPTTTTAAASGPTSTSTSTSAPSGPPGACTTSQLAVTIGTATGAAGSLAAPFVVRNQATAPCSLSGYFGLALVSARGQPVGPSPARQPALVGTAGAPSGPVVVAGAATAQFLFEWNASPAQGETCPAATSVELTAPDQTDHLTVAARTGGGAAIAPCAADTEIGPVTPPG